jgi:hypothetical protein
METREKGIEDKIKDIFKLRSGTADDENSIVDTIVDEKMTYRQWGYVQAGKTKASITSLEPCLLSVVQQKKLEMAADEQLQEEHRSEIEKEIAGLVGQKNVKENCKSAKEKSLDFEERKIEDYKREREEIKTNPNVVLGGDPPSKATFIIGAFIIAMLTIYLFVFYSSASYSAFFKTFTVNDGTVEAIFDAQAISKALAQSVTELLLICLIPAIFLGLGYLIHKFSSEMKKKSNSLARKVGYILAIVLLFVVTFVFDAILAYSIDEKIYNLNKFIDTPDYSVSLAFQDVRFWLIIFSGFVVYVIWGLVFNFVMDAYYQLDRVNVRLRALEEKIADSKSQCNLLKEDIQNLTNEITQLEAEIEKKRVDQNKSIFTPDAIALEINNFVAGWLAFMGGLGMSKNSQNDVKVVAERIIADLN